MMGVGDAIGSMKVGGFDVDIFTRFIGLECLSGLYYDWVNNRWILHESSVSGSHG